ncbi:hypothetical protein P9869_25970 [Streptomyces ossamyceticus]|nr:hypothetical protein [Streptomyces ossamyceticus]
MRYRKTLPWLAALAFLATACGGTSATGTDASSTTSSAADGQ